ncbi:hypothetical protein IMSHALPRED_009540 [Imshaugia aleurites]|uniref:Uncharacterized protein n=1 Tax=Imshaugia aleurites TaxID=172621 RepID=A0A8H3G3K5_9LECA|nr:hypothetical protein IMSHALPRED_009540 [Imshaugia aleurites]
MQGRKVSEDDDLSEVEEEPTSDSEEEVRSEVGASRSDDEEAIMQTRQAKTASKGTKKDEIEEEEVYSSVDSESDQVESEYQEDFEDDEEQLSATPVSKKSGVQTSSRPVARKV